jgi:hypothetical protein
LGYDHHHDEYGECGHSYPRTSYLPHVKDSRKNRKGSSRISRPLVNLTNKRSTTYYSVIIPHKRIGIVGWALLLFVVLTVVYVSIAMTLVLSLYPHQEHHFVPFQSVFDSHVHESERN